MDGGLTPPACAGAAAPFGRPASDAGSRAASPAPPPCPLRPLTAWCVPTQPLRLRGSAARAAGAWSGRSARSAPRCCVRYACRLPLCAPSGCHDAARGTHPTLRAGAPAAHPARSASQLPAPHQRPVYVLGVRVHVAPPAHTPAVAQHRPHDAVRVWVTRAALRQHGQRRVTGMPAQRRRCFAHAAPSLS